MNRLIITIDGPAGSGKSTAARLLAQKLDAAFLDTGAMYRAVTLAAMKAKTDLKNEKKLLSVLDKNDFKFETKQNEMSATINGEIVTEQLRNPEVTANAKYIASSAKVRQRLVQMQRDFAARCQKVVTEGRDQGTVAFPDADIKFFLIADPTKRAERRQAELSAKGINESIESIQKAIEERDKSDRSRTVGPLKPADDAVIIDTTNLSIEQMVDKLFEIVKTKCSNLSAAPPCSPVAGRRQRRQVRGGQKIKFLWYHFARRACYLFCRLCFRFKVSGKENIPADDAFILVSNHQSFLDPLFCASGIKRQINYLARDTLFKNPIFRRLLYSINVMPLRRDEADFSAMKTITRKLQAGQPVLLFPEATRTSDGRIAQFKPGLAFLCRRGNAAIVPVLIDGAFECWPRHKKIFSLGKKIVVRYGKSIPAEQAKSMPDETLAEFLTNTLRNLQTEVRLEQGKQPFSYT